MAPPSGTTAPTAGPATAPPSPRDTRGRSSRSARSGSWRRQRCRSGCRLSSPGQPPPTPGRRPGDLRRPRRPPPPPRLQVLLPRPRRGPQAHRSLRPQPQQAAPLPRRGARGLAPARAPGASPGDAAAAEEGGEGEQGAKSAALASRATAPAGYAAAPSTPRSWGTDPARSPSASQGAAAAAAEGREGAKYRATANNSHSHTSPLKPYPPKAAFPTGRTRHVRPPAPERTRQQHDAGRVIRKGGDSAQAGQFAGHESAERGTGGDRGSTQGQTQGTGLAHAASIEGESAGKVPRPAAAGGDRAPAAHGTTRDKEPERARARGGHAGARAGRQGGRPRSAWSGAGRGQRAWAQPRAWTRVREGYRRRQCRPGRR